MDNWSSHDVHKRYLRLRNQPGVEELNVRFRGIGTRSLKNSTAY